MSEQVNTRNPPPCIHCGDTTQMVLEEETLTEKRGIAAAAAIRQARRRSSAMRCRSPPWSVSSSGSRSPTTAGACKPSP